MSTPLEIAASLARQGGKLIATAATKRREVEHKSPVDLVTATDRAVQELVVSGLERAFPSHSIVAEEGADGIRPTGAVWYVDPLDGTANFVHGIPHCSVSISLIVDEVPQAAAVMNPFRDELFTAARGDGAHLNGKPIHVSATTLLNDAMLVSGFPYDRRDHVDFYLQWFKTFLIQARDVRRFGSAALDLCDVACGRFDGFWEWGLHSWDTAAGILILTEAGGQISDFDGAPFDPWLPRILATNGALHAEMLGVLGELGGALAPPGDP
ncbi:MAG: myo-inositol-1(or 4)-monophosphatase [Hyphomicrobiaceae bacterium]|jgi:myo-inositol-1(or 4)-monophosphatase